MRCAIAAFAIGVLWLQTQATLPDLSVVALAAATGLGLLAWTAGAARVSPTGAPPRTGAGVAAILHSAVLALAGLLLGFSWAAWRAELRLADALPLAWEGRDIELSGVVAALPQRFERGERFVFDVETVATTTARAPGRIILSWYHAWDDGESDDVDAPAVAPRALQPGERWRFTVRLKRPHGNANPHGFDYEAWLLERGIRATGTIRASAPATRLAVFVWRPIYFVERLRAGVRERFLSELPQAPYVGVLTALAVGDQRAIPSEQWQVFNRTGITHLVSISGLHVTMIAFLAAALTGCLWRRNGRLLRRLPAQKAALLAGWLAAAAYAMLAGFEVPAQRTLYMLGAVALTLYSGRHLGVSRILLLALLVVLAADPWAVLATGFWLSFGAVALLLYVGGGRLAGGRSDGRQEFRGRWLAGLRQWGVAQWAVSLGSLPLLLLFFQQFSLVSPLANALAIPLVSFVITPLALLYALLSWPPLLHLDHWLLSLLMRLLEWLADWPVWQQAAPLPWSVPLAVAGVAWLLLPRGFPARWLGLVLLLPVLTATPPRPPPGAAWVDVLDVGQGAAIVVRTAGHTLLYDTGPSYGGEADAGRRVVVPYLRALGVRRLDALLVSHRDKDHAGGMASVRAELAVNRFLSSMPDVGAEACRAGQAWEWDEVRFTVLHPDASAYTGRSGSSNNMSCVLNVASAGASLLLTGDIETADERRLLARLDGQLHSDVLLVPHHGGRGSSSAEFVAATRPGHAIFSAGYRNPFGHPRPDVAARYAANGSRLWRTDGDGALRVRLAGDATVEAYRGVHARYWHGR